MSEDTRSANEPSPLAIPTMPAHRLSAFRRAVAARLRAGAEAHTEERSMIAQLIREQEALSVALLDTAFETTMAHAFVHDMHVQEPNAAYAMPEGDAKIYVQGILANRARDAKAFIALLKDPQFLSTAKAEATQPAPAPKEYELPAIKQEEIIRRLVQPQDQDGAEPPVHVGAAAIGHRIVHQALANIFRPKAGELREPLQGALARAWPDAEPQQLQQLATSWLKARHDPAHSIADGLAPNGTLYREAMRRAEDVMAKKATMPASPVAAAVAAGAVTTIAAKPNLRMIEKQKTAEQRAEDYAYTINHAISCGTTDLFIVPTISGFFGARAKAKEPINLSMYLSEAGEYLKGEVFGDFVAVPFTIMVQRFFPGFMESVRHFVEPIAEPVFRNGAKNAAIRWGKKQGLEATNEEVVARAEHIYRHEIKHLPQAVVWNMFAFPAGVFGQMRGKPIAELPGVMLFKAGGALISNFILLGGRAVFPDAAEKFDRLDSKYVIRPAGKMLGSLVGIDDKAFDRIAKREADLDARDWRSRVSADHADIAPQRA